MNIDRDLVPRLLTSAFVLRAPLVVLLLSIGEVVLAQAPGMTEDQRMLPYAQPGELVDIGGRRINMHCAGTGTPTVILMAGLFSWSLVWYKTQPVIAQKARVCTFDRASYGFSDPAPRPQILSDVVDDLHAALKAGSIPEPYILVGHSLGGVELRLYAQRWPKEVVGMVLVDSSPAGEMLLEVNLPDYDEAEGRESYAADMLHCALLAAHGPLEPSRPEYKTCTSVAALPSDTPLALRMPLVVLTAKNTWGDTPAGIRFTQTFLKFWLAQHEALAHLSSRGVHRFIKGSDHEIQLEKPQAVIDAVDDVLRQVRAGVKS